MRRRVRLAAAACLFLAGTAAAGQRRPLALQESARGLWRHLGGDQPAPDLAPAPASAPRKPILPPGSVLEVVTFNLGLLSVPGAGDIVPLVDRRARIIPKLIGEFASREGIDILALQEVWWENHAKPLREELENRGYVVLRPMPRFPFLMGSGLLLAVKDRLTVSQAAFIPWDDKSRYEQNSFKGMLVCKIDVPGMKRPLLLLTTHTQSVSENTDTDAINAQRLQVRQMSRVLDQYTNKGRAAILLLGDFNISPEEPNYTALTGELGLVDSFEQVHPGQPGYTYSKDNPLNQGVGGISAPRDTRIDYVFVRGGAEETLSPAEAAVIFDAPHSTAEGPLYLSDHFGVRAKIRYEASRAQW